MRRPSSGCSPTTTGGAWWPPSCSGASTVDEVKAATGLSARVVGSALARLVDGELVERAADGTPSCCSARRSGGPRWPPPTPGPPPDPTGDAPPDAAKVLRTFFRGGRLTSIPTNHAKRLVILDRLAQEFEPGVRYSERQVNARLRPFHEDVAALRRYLVDDGFLDREAGQLLAHRRLRRPP